MRPHSQDCWVDCHSTPRGGRRDRPQSRLPRVVSLLWNGVPRIGGRVMRGLGPGAGFWQVRSHSCSPTGASPGHRDNDFHTWHQEYHQRPQDLKSIQTFIVPAWGWRREGRGTGSRAVGLTEGPSGGQGSSGNGKCPEAKGPGGWRWGWLVPRGQGVPMGWGRLAPTGPGPGQAGPSGPGGCGGAS